MLFKYSKITAYREIMEMVQKSKMIQAVNRETKSISRIMKKLSIKIHYSPEVTTSKL